MTGPQLLIATTHGRYRRCSSMPCARPKAWRISHALARMGFYDGTAIYRVEKDFIAQMGKLGRGRAKAAGRWRAR